IKDDCLDRCQFEAFLTQYETMRPHQDIQELDAAMQLANLHYILSNHMAHKAIKLAQRCNCFQVVRLFKLLSQHYQIQADLEQPEDLAPLPSDVPEVMISCSS